MGGGGGGGGGYDVGGNMWESRENCDLLRNPW